MINREKKIASIREVIDDTKRMKGHQVIYLDVGDVEFLLSELERQTVHLWTCNECGFAFDASHEDVDGGYSCPACAEIRLEEENRKLREERDYWQGYGEEGVEIEKKLLDRLQSAQHDLKVANDTSKRLNDKNLALVKREQKLIEGLRNHMKELNELKIKTVFQAYTSIRTLLQEIGVTVDGNSG